MSNINYYESYSDSRIKTEIINDMRKLYNISPDSGPNGSSNQSNELDKFKDGAQYYVDENIPAFTVVVLDNETVSIASAGNLNHANKILGITTESVLSGSLAYVQTEGMIDNPNWNLIAGKIYYLNGNGEINSVCDNATYVQKVGLAESKTKLVIQIGDAVML